MRYVSQINKRKIMKPKVTVLSVWFNRFELLPSSINSLLKQTYENFEVIIINDGSTDPRVDSYMLNLSEKDNRITYHKTTNKGFCSSIASALKNINSDFVAIHGAGDISLPKRLELQVNALQNDRSISFVGSKIKNYSKFIGQTDKSSPQRITKKKLLFKSNPFSHGEVMFRMHQYKAAGGYSEFFTYAQDRDLWLRLLNFGDALILPEFLYEKRNPTDSVSNDVKKLIKQQQYSFIADMVNSNKNKLKRSDFDLYDINQLIKKHKNYFYHKRFMYLFIGRLRRFQIRNSIVILKFLLCKCYR